MNISQKVKSRINVLTLVDTNISEPGWNIVNHKTEQENNGCSYEATSETIEIVPCTKRHVPHSDQPPELVDKRNTRERQRVHEINQEFGKLKRLIPYKDKGKRISKENVLKYAIDYIRGLYKMIAEHDMCMHSYAYSIQRPELYLQPHHSQMPELPQTELCHLPHSKLCYLHPSHPQMLELPHTELCPAPPLMTELSQAELCHLQPTHPLPMPELLQTELCHPHPTQMQELSQSELCHHDISAKRVTSMYEHPYIHQVRVFVYICLGAWCCGLRK